MGSGLRKIKQEMKGTGGGRWTTRAEAKSVSKKARRTKDKKEAKPLMAEDVKAILLEALQGAMKKYGKTPTLPEIKVTDVVCRDGMLGSVRLTVPARVLDVVDDNAEEVSEHFRHFAERRRVWLESRPSYEAKCMAAARRVALALGNDVELSEKQMRAQLDGERRAFEEEYEGGDDGS